MLIIIFIPFLLSSYSSFFLQLHRLVPTIIETLRNIDLRKISSMGTSTVGVDDLGCVYMWGAGGSAGGNMNVHNLVNSTYGYGLHDHRKIVHPQLVTSIPSKERVIDVSCGLGHVLFLLENGWVRSSGSGGNGRLGLGDTYDRKEPCLIESLLGENIVSVQCGASHSSALSQSGLVYGWGKNTQGQCGNGHLCEVLVPTLNKTLSAIEVITQIAAGWEHSIALSANGGLYAWGCGYKDNRRGIVPPVLGLKDNDGRTIPEKLTNFPDFFCDVFKFSGSGSMGLFKIDVEPYKIVSIVSGWDHCLALDNKGRVRSWGSGQNGKLGTGNEESVSVPTVVNALCGVHVISISAGCEHSAAVTDDGVVYTWGHGDGEIMLYLAYYT